MISDPVKILEHYRNLIYPVVQKQVFISNFPQQFQIPPQYQPDLEFVKNSIAEYPNRKGKYLRPVLLFLSAKAFGVPSSIALPVAAAMQVSEEWLLIHDDFEDNSLQRRGLPALQRQYSPEIAVNAGDALHIAMWNTLLSLPKKLPQPIKDKLLKEFSAMLYRTVLGQGVEIKWAQENKESLSDEDWFFVADGKTSYYTISGPLRLGAILGQAAPSQINRLTNLGVTLGRGFQLVDDILDVTSDFAGQKKQVGNDIYEGKRTILLSHLFRSIPSKDKSRLQQIMSKSRADKTAAEVQWVIQMMHEHGSIAYAKSLAQELRRQALDIFDNQLGFLKNSPEKKQLRALVSFALDRDH